MLRRSARRSGSRCAWSQHTLKPAASDAAHAGAESFVLGDTEDAQAEDPDPEDAKGDTGIDTHGACAGDSDGKQLGCKRTAAASSSDSNSHSNSLGRDDSRDRKLEDMMNKRCTVELPVEPRIPPGASFGARARRERRRRCPQHFSLPLVLALSSESPLELANSFIKTSKFFYEVKNLCFLDKGE